MSVDVAAGTTGAAIWGRLVAPGRGDLTPEAARAWLALDFPPEDHDRVKALGLKAHEGKLSRTERVELDEYLRVSAELAVIQSKARLSLKRAGLDA
jgi:hypothetical protein